MTSSESSRRRLIAISDDQPTTVRINLAQLGIDECSDLDASLPVASSRGVQTTDLGGFYDGEPVPVDEYDEPRARDHLSSAQPTTEMGDTSLEL